MALSISTITVSLKFIAENWKRISPTFFLLSPAWIILVVTSPCSATVSPIVAMTLPYSSLIASRANQALEVKSPTQIVITGCDKELVGQVAAKIRSFRKPEPYKGKGIKYSNETIVRKAGKTAG